ncbi:AI-2E family transporter [Promineifilum sp.]|uniref:AI-2E family transporter n=1 Tax=Promineifilum sp. TaxID=2664178 RepID=UPI0035B27B1D
MSGAVTSPPYTWTFWRVVRATLVFVSLGLSFWLLYRFNQVAFTLFVAIMLGTMFRPVVVWLQRRGLPGNAGVILIYLLLLAALIGFTLLVAPLIVTQTATIVAAMPGYIQTLSDWLVNNPNLLIGRLGELFSISLSPGQAPLQQTGQEILDSAGRAVGYIGSASQIVLTAGAILLIAFYWTLDGPRYTKSLTLLIPKAHRESTLELISAIETKVSAYIAGQGILMLLVGGMALAAYLLIGLPYVLVLALVAGLMEAVPLVGPFLGAVPAALVAMSLGPDKLVWVIVATLIIQQLENSLLVPRVMRKAVGVNPFVSLLAIFAFSSLLGVAGALMAIPTAAIIQLVLDRYVFRPDALEPEVSSGRDLAGRLRYEARDLAQDLRKQARLEKEGSDQTVTQIDRVMDEIESITIDLDALLAQAGSTSAP